MLTSSPRKNGVLIYAGLNLLFLLVVAIGYGIGAPQNPRILHLVSLFALCSSSVIDLDGLNGRHALLGIFLAMYFIYFGVQDLTNLFTGLPPEAFEGILSPTEAVILVGGVLLVFAYRFAVNFRNPADKFSRSYDWPLTSIVIVGLSMWLLGIAATYYWYFHVVTDKTMEGTRGIAKLSQLTTSALILAEMLQPLGVLLLAYAWRATKSAHLLFVLLLAVSVQVVFGFIIDIKGMALTGALLVVVTFVFTEGKIPKLWVAGVAIFVYLAFPVFQAYRAVVTGSGVARTEVLENLGRTLDKVLAAEERVNTGQVRAQTFLERLSLKSSVKMIVQGTSNGIPFQHGFTMTPILSAFLPRILWSAKPDIPTGRIVNRVFNVTDQDETYISPSHIGELYWNFGWPGVVVGMTIIGGICGIIGRFNLAECRTVTRLLILVLTLEGVIHGFEGSLSSSYVVWLRTMAAAGLLHLLFARVPVSGRSGVISNDARLPDSVNPQQTIALYPNLLK